MPSGRRRNTALCENLWQIIKLCPRPIPSETLGRGPDRLAPDNYDGGWSLWAPGTRNIRDLWSLSGSWRLQLPKAHKEKTDKDKQDKHLPIRGKGASDQLISALFLDNLTFISTWNVHSHLPRREQDMGKTVKWQNMKGEQSCPDQTSTPLKPARSTAWPAFLGLPGFQRREPGVLQ